MACHTLIGQSRPDIIFAVRRVEFLRINYSRLSCCSHVVVAWQHKQVGAKRSAAFAPKAFMAMAEDSEKKTKPILIAARERGMKI